MAVQHSSAKRWLIVFIACLALLLALAGYKFLQIRHWMAVAASYPEPSETVEATTAQKQNWQSTVTTVGEVLAPQSIELRNELEGRVVAVELQAGGAIKKDQMLLKLDASEDIAQLRAAQADAELAKASLARYNKLVAQKLTSREQYDQARAQYAVAVARAQELQAVIDKKIITAPFDGYAGLHHLQVGQYLTANTLITQLVGSLTTVWVDFYLPQQQGNIALGTDVHIHANGLPTTVFSGKITAIDPTISSSSRNFKVRAAVNNTEEKLKPGTLVDVQLPTTTAQSIITVPSTAVQFSDAGHFVYLIEPDKEGVLRAKIRNVDVGEENNLRMVIKNGLQTGERIAADGSFKLHDGMRVNIKEHSQESIK